MITEFKKSNLEPGMIIETNNGERYLVTSDNILIGKDGFLTIDSYDDNLRELDEDLRIDWDIQKVYKPYSWSYGFEKTLDCKKELIWGRGLTVVTKQEIADLLNIPINKLIISL